MKLFVPLLPDATRTELLRAMLLDGDAARESWRRWRATTDDPIAALSRDARRFLPLLYDSVRRNDLDADPALLTVLRSAYLTESLRSKAYLDVVNELTVALGDVPFLLIKGAAVGQLWYAEPALRHAHDVEIVVDDLAAVGPALPPTRFRPAHDGFVHVSQLPLLVHAKLPIAHAAPIALPNGARTLDATDALSLTLVHAAEWVSRQSLQWVCDADRIIRNGEVDFDRVAHGRRVDRMLTWIRNRTELI